MKIVGENIREKPVKELGGEIYYTNSAGDLVPIVARDSNAENDYVRMTSNKRLRTQSVNNGTYNPAKATGLQLWVKKGYEIVNTSGRFTTWGDLSGNGNDLTGDASSPYVMLSGERHAILDGVGAKFTTASALSLSQFTVCFAIRDNRAKAGILTGKGSDANAFISTSYSSVKGVTLSLASGETYSTSGGEIPTGEDCLVTVIKNASNEVYVRVNGVQVHTETATATALQIDQIGKLGSSADTFMGNMYEIAIYNTALTGDTLASVELGIMNRNRIA